MESAVDMQLRSKADPPPPSLPPAESIRRERQCGQQRQSAAAQGTRVPRWVGGRARARGLCKEKPPFCLTPRQKSLTFWGLWNSLCSTRIQTTDAGRTMRNLSRAEKTTLKPNRQFLWGVCEAVECDGLSVMA